MRILLDGVKVFIDNWQLTTGILSLTSVFTLPLFSRRKTNPSTVSGQSLKSVFTSTGILFALFLVFSLCLRLAYISRALFPSYFDSAQHYTMIKNIMANDILHIFNALRTNYYHMGFHFIAAFFAFIYHAQITTTMLILGQVILAVLFLPFFFIMKFVTHSNRSGMFAAALSVFGWYMPAHAVDWGKYPALLSMGLIPFVLCLVYLSFQHEAEWPSWKRWVLYGFIGIVFLATVFSHTRSLIIFGIVLIAWGMSVWWHKLPQVQRRLSFLLLLVIIILEAIVIQRQSVLSLLFDPYLNEGMLTTSLVIFLSIFAYGSFPQLTFINLAVIGLLLAGLFIPVPELIPGHTQLTLMDRPYVEMILFMPLSLLGGLGLAGLEKKIKKSYEEYAVLIGIGLILIYGIANYRFYPSDCCVIVGNDDVAAMAWMEDQLPADARIGIASTKLKVIAANVSEGDVGSDAGIWITPLTGRVTILLPVSSDFERQSTLDMICRTKISHLFVGERGQNFDREMLNSYPEWYRPLLLLPKTGVYELIGCDK